MRQDAPPSTLFPVTVQTEKITCPLCKADDVRAFSQDKRRNYYQCGVCSLVFVLPWQFLSEEDEKKRYDLHQNSPEDLGYRCFLSRMLISLQHNLAPGSHGLDFGSGPEPTLSLLFEEAGHSMTLYDIYYQNEPAVFERVYDFITATEVVEHLREPKKDLDRVWNCLKQGGRLGIMTRMAVDQEAFSQWHYKNDLTHICFYAPATFAWLARAWNADVTFPESDIAIFHKRNLFLNPLPGGERAG